MSKPTEVTEDSFKQFIDRDGIVVLDWWAPWCGPCRAFAPVFEKAAERYTDIAFGKINTDEQQQLAQIFEIRSIPTLMIFRDKVLLFAQPGSLPAAAFDQVLEKVKSLDMAEVRKKIEEAEKNLPPQS